MLFAVNNNAYSQEESKLSFGVKAGFASGSLLTKHFIEASSVHSGYQAGLYANFSILEYLDISMEVMYSNVGGGKSRSKLFLCG